MFESYPDCARWKKDGDRSRRFTTTYCEVPLGDLGMQDIQAKNYRDTGYLGGKLKGYGIFRKGIPGY